VSPLLLDAADRIDDAFPDELCRRLVPLLARLAGTADDGREEDRVLMAQDWMARTYLPVWLRAAGFGEYAARLRALAPLRDHATTRRAAELAGEACARAGRSAPCRAEGFRLFGLAGAAVRRAETATLPWRHAEPAGPAFYRTVTLAARNAALGVALAAIGHARAEAGQGGAAHPGGTTARGASAARDREERDRVERARARAALEPAVAFLQGSAVDLFGHMVEPPNRAWPYEGRAPSS
jgi:hypothetical protein